MLLQRLPFPQKEEGSFSVQPEKEVSKPRDVSTCSSKGCIDAWEELGILLGSHLAESVLKFPGFFPHTIQESLDVIPKPQEASGHQELHYQRPWYPEALHTEDCYIVGFSPLNG